MPDSIAKSIYDPVYAQELLDNKVHSQLSQKSLLLSVLFGGAMPSPMKKESGIPPAETVKFTTAELIQENIEIDDSVTNENIALSASHTTAIDTTVREPARTLYGPWVLNYATYPWSLEQEIKRTGSGAKVDYLDVMTGVMANSLTTAITDAVLGTGAGNAADGIRKWLSLTDTKWGLNTTTAANYFFRGQWQNVADASFNSSWLRSFHRLCRTGYQLAADGTTPTYSDGYPKLGIVDYTTYDKLITGVESKQNIPVTSLQNEINRLGSRAVGGITIDNVVYYPCLSMDRLAHTLSKAGVGIVINPEDWKVFIHSEFSFTLLTDPSRDLKQDKISAIFKDFANFVWGRYAIAYFVWNLFCKHPRNNGIFTVT